MLTTTLVFGFMTHHFFAPSLDYCAKIGGLGTIINPHAAILVGHSDYKIKLGLMAGKDSVCGNIRGVMGTYEINDSWEFVFGGYNTNYQLFVNRGFEPIHIGKKITPIVGFNHKFKLSENVSLNTIVSMGIIVHGIRFDF